MMTKSQNKIKTIFLSSFKYYKHFKLLSKGFIKAIILLITSNILLQLFSVSLTVITKNIIDSAVYNKLQYFGLYLALFVVIVVLSLINIMFLKYHTAILSEKIRNKFQNSFIRNLYKLSWNEYSSYHSGDIMTRVTYDINSMVNLYIIIIPNFISLIIQLIVVSLLIIKYDISLAIFALFFTPFVAVASVLFGKKN